MHFMHFLLNPIAFSIGAIKVHWYGIILGTGALVGLLLAVREGKRFNIVPDFFMDLLLIGVPSAIIGARIYYVAFKWEDYRDNLSEIFMIWHGGIAIYGALIGAIIAAILYVRSKGYTFWRIADICAPSLIAGQMIGRWGNFMNQEAHGGPVTEEFLRGTLHLPNFIVDAMLINGQYYHPTFLYESLWNLLGLLFLFWLRRRPGLRTGELFISYFIWYSVGRFFVEGFRTDSLSFAGPDWLAGLMHGLWSPMSILFEPGAMPEGENVRISQLLAVLIVIVGLLAIWIRRAKGYANVRYTDPIVSPKAAVGEGATGTALATGAAVSSAGAIAADSVDVGDADADADAGAEAAGSSDDSADK
jgi:phosphatidylglycerol:prolipoprotein diacylglycerol transferase